MKPEIKTIELKIYGGLATVNCYLIKIDNGFILIDTGTSNKRIELLKELKNAGCKQEDLKLIIITHGDADHAGNAAYLHEKYVTKIAMHKDDSRMIEDGNMSFNRKTNFITRILFSLPYVRLGFRDRFKPDIYVGDGEDLSDYRFKAKVIQIPGHSKGSIGILTEDGDLLCGDLLENTKKPKINPIMDDKEAAYASVRKLKELRIRTVYPGHGKSFSMDGFIKEINGEI